MAGHRRDELELSALELKERLIDSLRATGVVDEMKVRGRGDGEGWHPLPAVAFLKVDGQDLNGYDPMHWDRLTTFHRRATRVLVPCLLGSLCINMWLTLRVLGGRPSYGRI
jgi:hypothetical protein